jgi:hypothetical protein
MHQQNIHKVRAKHNIKQAQTGNAKAQICIAQSIAAYLRWKKEKTMINTKELSEHYFSL